MKKISAIAETKDLYAVEAAPGEVIGAKSNIASQQYAGSAVPLFTFGPNAFGGFMEFIDNTEVGEMFNELLVREIGKPILETINIL